MATTVIEVKYKNSGAPVVFNNEVTDPAATGVVIADLLDDTGTATGYTLTHPGPFSGATGSSSWAVSSPDPDFPLEFFRSGFYASDAAETSATPVIGNLPNGATFTLQVAGNTADTNRDTNFTASNGAPAPALYDVAGTDPVTAPVEISGTVSGGQITLSMNGVGTFSYLNGFRLAITTVDGPSITTADDITDETQPATVTLANNTTAPTAITINGVAVTGITDEGAGVYSYTPPLIADDATADLAVTVDGQTLSTTISYANTFVYNTVPGASPAANSVLFAAGLTTGVAYELKITQDLDAGVGAVAWGSVNAGDNWGADIDTYDTPAAGGSGEVVVAWLRSDTLDTGEIRRTLSVVGGAMTVYGTIISVGGDDVVRDGETATILVEGNIGATQGSVELVSDDGTITQVQTVTRWDNTG